MSASHAVIATAAHAPVCSTELCPVRVIHSWKVSCDDSWWRGPPMGTVGQLLSSSFAALGVGGARGLPPPPDALPQPAARAHSCEPWGLP